jgi:hypothetical protein
MSFSKGTTKKGPFLTCFALITAKLSMGVIQNHIWQETTQRYPSADIIYDEFI